MKGTISWRKFRYEAKTQQKSNNQDYLIDSTFRNINSLFVLSFKTCKYYMPLVISFINKPVVDQPIKTKQKANEKLFKISRNDDCKSGNVLDYFYHQKYFKLTGIDLSRQKITSISQQISFT